MNKPTDTEILDWLERNLIHLSVPSGVDMSGNRVAGQLHNEARGSGGGPSYVRVWSPDIRGDELEEMNFTQYDSPIIHEAGTGYRKQDENIR